MTATVHRIKAGPLPHADQRRECRLSKDVIGELMQAGAHRRNALAHTSTPPEREYAERFNKPRSIFWRCVVLAYAVAAAAAYYYLCNH